MVRENSTSFLSGRVVFLDEILRSAHDVKRSVRYRHRPHLRWRKLQGAVHPLSVADHKVHWTFRKCCFSACAIPYRQFFY